MNDVGMSYGLPRILGFVYAWAVCFLVDVVGWRG